MALPQIMRLAPNRVWRTYTGGKILDALEGKTEPQDAHFPEDWIASTTRAVNKGREHLADEGLSAVVVDGRKRFLKDLIREHPMEATGKKHFSRYGENAGFLLKLLDSAVRLHIQCHPTVPFAKKFLNSHCGKTEGYIILGSRKEVGDPYIYFGFQRVPEKEAFRRAILEQNTAFIQSCFEKIPVRPGDVFLVPGGQPHAIGEGIFMMEIMEPTDFVVRIEFERGGYLLPEASRFMGRDVDFALSMFEFKQLSLDAVREKYFVKPKALVKNEAGTLESLFDERYTDCFRVKKMTAVGEFRHEDEGFYVLVIASGKGMVRAGRAALEFKPKDRFFIPAGTDEIRICPESNLVEAYLALPPDSWP